MADSKPPAQPEPVAPSAAPATSNASSPTGAAAAAASTTATPNATPTTSSTSTSTSTSYKAAERNPAFRMLGLPSLPKKLPSRNWTIFLSVTAAISAAIIYDKREKRRATARWARAVAPLAQEPISDPSQLPRKLTVMLAAPPGEGLRVAQDHFIEYAKPVLAASGLDWEFVQGRQEGDVRAAVAEKIRRRRRQDERPDEELLPTEENLRDAMRKKNGIEEYKGDCGDLVIGRNAWKEYVRGLHEGWLGPLDAPPQPEEPEKLLTPTPTPEPTPTQTGSESATASTGAANDQGDNKSTSTGSEAPSPAAKDEEKKEEPEPEEKKKPSRPPQPVPYNTTDDYVSSSLPTTLPARFSPSSPVQFPHILGFLNTPARLKRFFNRRALADDVGREVAAVCFAAHRGYEESAPSGVVDDDDRDASQPYEQQRALVWEEKNWLKSVWKEEEEKASDDDKEKSKEVKEKVWAKPMVLDPRIASRMRRFEMLPEDEERARAIVVPEEEVEGWIKGNLRSVVRWGAGVFESKPKGPNVGDVEDA